MPTITLTDPTTNTTVASGLVATNNANLRTLLNSGLDYVNLKGNPQLVANETIQWDGTQFIRGPAITTSAFSSGPPGSPKDKDIWIATSVDSNGTRWAFQYNAGSGSSYKWEFIGGPSRNTTVATGESTSSSSFVDLTTVGPSYTIVRGGDYEVLMGAAFSTTGSSNGGNAQVTLAKNGTSNGYQVFASMPNITGATINSSVKNTPATASSLAGLAVNDVLKLMYAISNGTSTTFSGRYMYVLPIRIS